MGGLKDGRFAVLGVKISAGVEANNYGLWHAKPFKKPLSKNMKTIAV
jgi:hypothetical protein